MVSVKTISIDYGMGQRGALNMNVPPSVGSTVGSIAIPNARVGSGRGPGAGQFAAGSPVSVLEPLLSKYDVSGSQKIGYGKHSEVITVRGKATGMEYAVKVLPLSAANEAKVRREVLAMGEFNHRWSTNLVDVCQCNERLPGCSSSPPFVCVVMNRISNVESLSNTIRTKGGNAQLAFRMLQSLCSCLQEMHSRGLVHLDIWSENVLVDPAGNCYLIDFGCTESLRRPTGPYRNTGLNIPYLSPQVCKKDPPAPSDDMWALGLTLTELVTGRIIIYRMGQFDTPFYTKGDLLNQAITETEQMGGPVLGAIARRCLEPNASKRATAAEVLGMASSGFSGVAPASTPSGYQSQKFHPPALGGTTSLSYPGPAAAAAGLAPGMQVSYQASSHNASYSAMIVGRASNGRGWLIQVQGGGSKEVPDHDAWRLKPKGALDAKPSLAPVSLAGPMPGLAPKTITIPSRRF